MKTPSDSDSDSASTRLRAVAARYCAGFDNSFRYFSPDANPIFVRGQGPYLFDADGCRYVDMNNGWSSTSFGHANPRLIAAMMHQVSTLHQTANRLTDSRIDLCQVLALASRIPDAKVFLDTTGTSVVEAARKIVIAATGKPNLVSFRGAFHGRSFGALEIYNHDAMRHHGVCVARNYVQVPYPHCCRCPVGRRVEDCNIECLDPLVVATARPDVGGVIVEPALGQAGYLFPAPKAMARLNEIVRASRTKLVLDEIQMGIGRTGHTFLHHAYAMTPDIVLVGKSMAGGLIPLSALIGRAELVDQLGAGMHSTTFAGSPVGSRVALLVMRWLGRRSFVAGVRKNGAAFRQELEMALEVDGLARKVQVEGEGLATVLDFRHERTGTPDARAQQQAQEQMFRSGLYSLGGGMWGNRLPLLPSLLVNENWLRDVARRVSRAIRDAYSLL